MSLAKARHGFATKLAGPRTAPDPAPVPPPAIFSLIRYRAAAGKLSAYITPDPGDGRKHPAIIWITGGDCNTINDLWHESPRRNDQTAAAYRKAGIVLMFPSLRGGNDNPGQREGFFGEVEDVLAAADHLASQSYVDSRRIYLGGHSTGGTLVMLVAESSDRFRSAFAFGPASDPRRYPASIFPYAQSDPREMELRSPGRWLSSVRGRLFVIEGAAPPVSNIASLKEMARASTSSSIQFLPVSGFDHFSILAPMNELIAAKILRDDGPATNIAFSDAELDGLRR